MFCFLLKCVIHSDSFWGLCSGYLSAKNSSSYRLSVFNLKGIEILSSILKVKKLRELCVFFYPLTLFFLIFNSFVRLSVEKRRKNGRGGERRHRE